MAESLICDPCGIDGKFVPATDRIELRAFQSKRRKRIDVCDEHLAAAFDGTPGRTVSSRPAGKRQRKPQPTVAGGRRRMQTEYRCDEHDVEYTGPGLSVHWRHAHGGRGKMPDDVKAGFRAAYERRHGATAA